MLEIANRWYDDLLEALDKPSYAERQAALDAVDAQFAQQSQLSAGKVVGSAFSRKSRSENIANILSGLFLPAMTAAISAEDRANNLRQLERVAAALALHRSQHDAYPKSLNALLSAILSDLPTDVYGNVLEYQPTSDGYLLYSRGPNGMDEAGSHQQWQVYKGYETTDIESQDRQLRRLLGEPAADQDTYGFLRAPEDADDLALRLPLYHPPLPRIEQRDE